MPCIRFNSQYEWCIGQFFNSSSSSGGSAGNNNFGQKEKSNSKPLKLPPRDVFGKKPPINLTKPNYEDDTENNYLDRPKTKKETNNKIGNQSIHPELNFFTQLFNEIFKELIRVNMSLLLFLPLFTCNVNNF
jgi:hypothetical protein